MQRFFLFLLASFASLHFAHAQSTPIASTASFHSEQTSIAPGKPFTVALKLVHPTDWHSYYLNSGGVEQAPAIQWSLPPGFHAGPIQWPVPSVKEGYSGKSFVYIGSPSFLVEITAPATLEVGTTASITANATWQICDKSCISEKAAFSILLPVTALPAMDPEVAGLFADARRQVPRQVASLTLSAEPINDDVQIRIEPASALQGTPSDFVPDQAFLQPVTAGGSITREGDAWLIRLKRAKMDVFDTPIPQGNSFSGILLGADPIVIPNTPIAAAVTAPASLGISAYLKVLGGMFIGGLILNLMPCVFPVIGLKIMGFVQQSGHDRKKIALHGLLFTAGVLSSFGVLSSVLFAARAATTVTGWGYQLQNPWVVLVLMLLMFVLALNMFGLFEIGTSATSVGGNLQQKQGLSGSFFSGILATVVATPCSGPFLGVAIGTAIGLPAFQFFAAFTAMALGLSLPYLILSIFPKLIDHLPRPGAWMESFKQAMSFLLFATTGYLLWVYAGQIGLDNLLGPIFGLSSIAIAAWIYGRWNLPHRPLASRRTAIFLTLLFAVAGLFLTKPPEKSALLWEKWSQERVDELSADGTPVFIDFTAQWCATCQVNKRTAYTKEVIALMKSKGIVALKADKTNADPKIEAKLQELGRSAIPVNVLVTPGQPPVITPELLSAGYLKDLFGKLPAQGEGGN
jgi:DsbC/DsbD-like thiol-disulfide interchange protein/cytochrome c biogenesis protein CcdA